MRPSSSPALGAGMETVHVSDGARGLLRRWAAPGLVFVTVAALGADQGGYFPTPWGWAALLMLGALGVLLAVNLRFEAGKLELVLIVAFALLTSWTATSILWTDSTAGSVLDVERLLVYLSALAAVLLLAGKTAVQLLGGAVLTAIVLIASYSLSTRLFPDRLGRFDPISGYRLSDPVGYWNGLGIFVAMGVLLAIGFAARARHTFVRVGAAVAVTVLLPTLYFTFSRGAWLALALGCACALLYDPRRLHLAAWMLLLAPASALAAFKASRSDALTHTDVPLARAVHDGHRLALTLLILLPLAALCALVGPLIETRFTPSRRTRRAFGALLAAVPVLAMAVVLVHYGGPGGVASRAYDSFKSPPIELQPNPDPNLNKRLFSLTSNGRIDLWHVAWDDYVSHRALGSGAGTFARHWYKDRPAPFNAQDAHGAYIEALAELGPLGLVILLVAVIVPLVAATRARNEPLAPFLLAAYIAFILHAGVDWDLEQTAIGLAGLTCGASLLVAAREPGMSRAWSPSFRGVGLAFTVAVTGFVLFGLLGNSALATSNSARGDRNWVEAEKQANRARQLLPWSPQPWVALGSAQSAQGQLSAARASFRRAAAKDPGDWTLWYGLAVITRGGERKAAIAQARLLNPRSNELNLLVSRSG
jgi:hypothetical protein